MSRSEIESLVDEWVIGRNAERNRLIIKDRLIDGLTYEKLAEKKEAPGTAMTVAVCHGGVIAEILNSLFPTEKESVWDWMPQPGCGYIMDVVDGEVRNPCLLGEVTIY